LDKIIQIVDNLLKKEEIEWDTIIQEMINQQVIDPLNIDLEILIDYYIKIIKELKKKENFDFILSSKVLLLLVYFLKLKVESLSRELFFDPYLEEDFLYEDSIEEEKTKTEKNKKEKKETKKLLLKVIYERRRKVTFEDLKEAIKEVFKEVEKRKKRKKLKKENLEDLATLEYNIEKEIDTILKILSKIEKEEITFFELLNFLKIIVNKEEIIKKFIPLLYLDNQGKIELIQKDILKELLIKKLFTNEQIENNGN
jgi:segregation and condensation protein A